jgi:hypothetical protein
MKKTTPHSMLIANLFRIILSISIGIFSCSQAIAQATSEPAYANMQRAVGGIIQQTAQARGYSTTDPRTYGTLYGIGKAAVSAASGAGAVSLAAQSAGVVAAAATAPAWLSLLGTAVVFAGVGYVVNIALDKSISFLFDAYNGQYDGVITVKSPSDNSSSSVSAYGAPSPISDPRLVTPNDSYNTDTSSRFLNTEFPYQVTSWNCGSTGTPSPPNCPNSSIGVRPNNFTAPSGTYYIAYNRQQTSYYGSCVSVDFMSVAYCLFDAFGQTAMSATSTTNPVSFSTSNLSFLSSMSLGMQPADVLKATFYYVGPPSGSASDPLFNFYLATPISGDPTTARWTLNSFALNVTFTSKPPVICPYGSASFNGNPCKKYNTGVSTSSTDLTNTKVSQASAISSLSSAQLSKPVDYAAMATLVNSLWQKAAADPSYAGVPYSSTQPITASEVQAWAAANSGAYPSVRSLTATVVDTATDLAPSTSTSTDTQVAPAVSPTASSATNTGQQNPTLNLGPDPNIAPPTLETTPTASQILAPIIGLLPSLKNFTVPAHSGECPKPAFDAFGKHFVMDSHCAMFEQNRSALTGFMLLAFALVAIFIVLSA